MEGAVLDTLCSGGEETPLKPNVCIEISESAEAIAQATLPDNRPPSAESEDKLSSATPKWPCVPQIVVMESAAESFSRRDSSLNPKDTAPTTTSSSSSRTKNNNKRRGNTKKSQRKDQDVRAGAASVLAEGHHQKQRERQRRGGGAGGGGELARPEAAAVSSEPMLIECSWLEIGLAAANTAALVSKQHGAMERADLSPSYTSDEWEEEETNQSDTDGDHTDSSDDDDPKSQVDRLIDRGARMYMEDENSALSSEDESSDDDSDDDYDSESDITDVSPLISASASPLGLSPVLPRRTIPTSPLALHDNRELSFAYDPNESPFVWDASPDPHHHSHHHPPSTDNHHHESTNMDLLLQAVIELENKNHRDKLSNLNHHNNRNSPQNNSVLPPHSNDQVYIHPIRDNPHHHHLRKNVNHRKNMSFSNEEVRKIDQENKILLKKIMAAHTRTKPGLINPHHTFSRTYHKPSNSSVSRKNGDEKIRKENLLLFKKIQEAKPSKDIVDRRVAPMGGIEPLLASVGVSSRSLRSPTSSCGAFMRSIAQPPHVSAPPPRKETAL